MTKPILLFTLLACSVAACARADSIDTLRGESSPPAGNVSQELFWIADTVKMDRFLAKVDLTNIRRGSHSGEILPDTRVAWRDYVRQARNLAAAGREEAAIFRIWQMLKLAAVYREFGGLQNVVQGEEIRALAAQATRELNFGGRIKSPYLEYSVEECIDMIERKAGLEKTEVRPTFWQSLIETAGQSFVRLANTSNTTAQTRATLRE